MSYKDDIKDILDYVRQIETKVTLDPSDKEKGDEILDWGYTVMKMQKEACAKQKEKEMKQYKGIPGAGGKRKAATRKSMMEEKLIEVREEWEYELKEEQDKAYAYSRAVGYLYNKLEDLYYMLKADSGAADMVSFIEAAILQVDEDLEAL